MDKKSFKVEDKLRLVLVGNPNSGKSTLFNSLTGLNQRIGNFPGVTVEKKIGSVRINEKVEAEVIDLPGTYSLSPRSEDERVTFDYLNDSARTDLPELIVVVADASNLKRNLLLATQLIDSEQPTILVLNMMDVVERNKQNIDIEKLQKRLGIPVIPMNARLGKGTKELKSVIGNYQYSKANKFIEDHESKDALENTINRFEKIKGIIADTLTKSGESRTATVTRKIDSVFTHPIWGFSIFLFILFLIFQAIFSWSSYPMEWIEGGFLVLGNWLAETLPQGVLNDLLVDGVLAGLGGIIIFIPQIAMLFMFIAILEDTGYLSRVSFLTDVLLKRFGLNGRSIIPLLGGAACAVPAIMSARTIANKKERLLTIFVTPLISCSARIPVYTLLIALVIPADKQFLSFNLQGIIMMGLYLLGFAAAMVTAFVMKYVVKSEERSHFIMELPIYRTPRWSNVAMTILNKTKLFLFEAGKIIIAVSIVLWVLSSYGPGDEMANVDAKYKTELADSNADLTAVNEKIATDKLEVSYAGHVGKFIEPAIRPLGFDWKIGISIITSFAAREVFVGTMATLYTVGDEENTEGIKAKMQRATFSDTGEKVYTRATGYSLLIFYAFALQCMATVAIVVKETGGWKWPIIQLVYMGALAYFSSLLIYQIFS
ncbi:ferrous iron transport protein B [Vicingaceae bacterium]|nr:ferrous iron transport protein B [Vicingaceae bacterium]MDC1450909.1 ferrous iron transport protein B [Vicingaceae bacterium]